MSINRASNRGLKNSFLGAGRIGTIATSTPSTPWVRPADWLALPTLVATDQKFVGLHAIYTDSNFLALTAVVGGTPVTFTGTGDTVNQTAHGFANDSRVLFSDIEFRTNVLVTFTDAGDVVNRVAHGFVDGNTVIFNMIVNTSGISINTTYFVVGATANTFQVASTSGGAVIALAHDSSGTLSGKSVTFTDTGDTVNRVAHGFANGTLVSFTVVTTTTGIAINTAYFVVGATADTFQLALTSGGAAIDLVTNGSGSVNPPYTVNWGDGTTENFASGVIAYRTYNYATFDTGNLTLTTRGYKQAIVTVTPQSGQNLTTLNLHQKHNQSNLNSYSSGFLDIAIAGSSMTSLLVSAATVGSSTQNIFFHDLEQVQILSTGITNASNLFNNCVSLSSVNLNTASASNFSYMFGYCYSLQTIPLLNTAAGTNFSNMFSGCTALQAIPLLNTAAGTNFSNMFSNCPSLQTIPLLNTAAGTNFTGMFDNCRSLQNGTISGQRYALSYATLKLSQSALETIIANLGTSFTQGLVLTVSTNWGAVTPVALSGTTTISSATVTMASTTGITVGMQVTGVGTPSTTPIAVTTTGSGDTVNLTAHGLSNTDEVSFAAITTTTGIVINRIYFVVGATANTFQVAATSGGTAIDLVTDGSATLRYKATVTAISANVNVTLSRPATSTATNTLSFRDLKTNTALLKGWSVTG